MNCLIKLFLLFISLLMHLSLYTSSDIKILLIIWSKKKKMCTHLCVYVRAVYSTYTYILYVYVLKKYL